MPVRPGDRVVLPGVGKAIAVKSHLNLIPESIQRRQAYTRIVRGWTSVILATTLFCALICALEWSRGISAARRLLALDSTCTPLESLTNETRELNQLVADLRAREELTLQLSIETHGVTLLGAVSEAAEELGGSIYLVGFDFQRQAGSGTRGVANPHTLSLEGAGIDSLVVAAFASRLRESGVFTEVTIDSTRPIHDEGDNKRFFCFEIACVL